MMKLKAKLLILQALFSLLSFNGLAQGAQSPTIIGVTHPQVKQAIDSLSKLYNWNIKPIMVFQVNGSAHTFEPSMRDLKNLVTQDYLIVGPTGHQKWLKKSKLSLPKKTFHLEAKVGDHFWLNEELACKSEREIFKILLEWKLVTKRAEQGTNLWCQNIREQTQELKKVIVKQNITHVILAHDATRLLFESFGLQVIVLFSDDHHAEITSGVLKQALMWHQSNKIKEGLLHINEPEIKWPSPLKENSIRTIIWSPLAKNSLVNLTSLIEKSFGEQP